MFDLEGQAIVISSWSVGFAQLCPDIFTNTIDRFSYGGTLQTIDWYDENISINETNSNVRFPSLSSQLKSAIKVFARRILLLLKSVTKGFAAIILFLLFPLVWFFGGFVAVDVSCHRTQVDRPPDCRIHEARLLGLYSRHVTVFGVSNVDFKKRNERVKGGYAIILTGQNGGFPLSQHGDDFGDDWRRTPISKINRFLKTPSQLEFSYQAHGQSIFGWLAAVYFVFLIVANLYFWSKRTIGKS